MKYIFNEIKDLLMMFTIVFSSIACIIGIVLLIFHLTSGINVGEGTYVGTVIDTEWSGVHFKSCYAKFKTNTASSTMEGCATRSKEVCEWLQSNLGKSFKVSYRTTLGVPIQTGSTCNIRKLELK